MKEQNAVQTAVLIKKIEKKIFTMHNSRETGEYVSVSKKLSLNSSEWFGGMIQSWGEAEEKSTWETVRGDGFRGGMYRMNQEFDFRK